MQDDDNSLLIITKYLDNPDDKILQSEVTNFRKQSKANEECFLKICQIWELSSKAGRLSLLNEDKSIKLFKKKLQKTSPYTNSLTWFKNIAATILLVAIGYWFFTQNHDNEFLVKNTNANQVDSLTLADGTVIILAQNSQLKYPKKFTLNERTIFFTKGQAFFKVARDEAKPFRIVMKESVVTVLGTSFNIKLSPSAINLGVKTGTVQFSPYKNAINSILTAGQALLYNRDKKEISSVDATNADAWLTKELVFVDTPLEEVCKQLSNYYQVDIKLFNSSASVKKLNATFKNQSFDEVLEVLSKMYDIKIVKESNHINMITPNSTDL